MFVVDTIPSSLPLMTYPHFCNTVTRVTQQVQLVEQELLILPEHPSPHLFHVMFVLLNL